MKVVRTQAEIEAVMFKAQAVAFAAEDREEHDYFAEGVYDTLKWLTGDGDAPEFEEADDEEDETL